MFTRLIAALIVLAPIAARAQATGAPADIMAIQGLVESQAEAWNRGDAEAFARNYAEDGSFTNIVGQQLYGKAPFIAQHARIFSTIYKGSHNAFSVGKIHFVRQDVAVVDIDGTLTGAKRIPPGIKVGDDGAIHVKLQEVMSKENGSWMIQAFHNVVVTPLPSAPADH